MDFIPTADSDLGLCVRGNRKLRYYRNKNNPPQCRRRLFTEPEDVDDLTATKMVDGSEPGSQSPPAKDWVTCLKSCLDFDDVTSMNQFQSYLVFMNSYETQNDADSISSDTADDSLNSNDFYIDYDAGKDFVVLNNISDDSSSSYESFQDQEVLVYYNNTNENHCMISPEHVDNGNRFYADVMLSSTEDEGNVMNSCLTIDTPSTDIWPEDEVMGSTFEVDHEEVVQSLSGSFDTISCFSDDFSGSDEGFPEDFMYDE